MTTHQRIRLSDHTIACTVSGSGPAVVLLHGWPQTSHAWRKVVPLLSSMFTLVVPDLPGFGDSSHPTSGHDKKTVAATLRELLQGLGHQRFGLVGHDVGGQVAYAYAKQWPDEVSRLCMIECGIPGIMDPVVANPLRGGSWHYAFNMLADLPEALVCGRERIFLDFLFWRDRVGLFDADAITAGDLDVYERSLARPGAVRSYCGYYRALGQDEIDNAGWTAEPFSMPTLLVAAAQSHGTAWLDVTRNVAREPSTLLVDRCGHYVPEEQPYVLAQALRAFLAA